MLLSRLAILGLCVLSVAAASAAPVTLYGGSSAPGAEGWTRSHDGGAVVSDAGTSLFTTVNSSASTRISEYDTYSYDTGAGNFIVSIRLKVASSSHNLLDGGLVFSALGTGGAVLQNDRRNSLMIDEGQVLWGDETGGAAAVTTGEFHEYVLRYLNGNLDFFLDASYEDIQSGAAAALLSRPSVLPFNAVAGVIVFGDATNDRDFNSQYTVDFVKFQNLDATLTVPEPGTLALVGLSLVGILARRRRA